MAKGDRRARGRADPPHVALIVETSSAYGRELLGGMARFVREEWPLDGLPWSRGR